MPAEAPLIPCRDAARLLLAAQGLLQDPSRAATRAELSGLVRQLGFVQLDTINVVARAHDLTLHSRLRKYDPLQLKALLEEDRSLFEGFTHDASIVPTEWYPQWKHRFRQDKPRIEAHPWWRNLLGEDAEAVCRHVLERIAAEGPLRSADFEHPEKRGPWWGWKPQKAALDYLWRTGRLAVARRDNFHKVYDLAERVLPGPHAAPEPSPDEHRRWAAETAAERLVFFTPRELAGFWDCLETGEARAWCLQAEKEGRLVMVRVESAAEERPQDAYALSDWEDRRRALPEAPGNIRLLSPFDPVIRDRDRCRRRFGFDYRFEAFTPEDRRVHGYYVLPILEGDRFVGRLDPKLHRGRQLLEVRGLWWEPGVRPALARRRKLRNALERLARFVGATELAGLPD